MTFATQQNDVPLIADLVIANPTEETLEDLVLELTTEPELVAPRRWTIDRLRADSDLRIKDRHGWCQTKANWSQFSAVSSI